MECATKNRQSEEKLRLMVKRAFGENILIKEYKELEEGLCNIAYLITLSDGRETVLKIAPDNSENLMSNEFQLMKTEVIAMDLVRKQGCVNVAQVYYYDESKDICNSEYFFMEKLEGVSLNVIKDKLNEEEIKDIESQLGKIVYSIQKIKGEKFGHLCTVDRQCDTWFKAFFNMILRVINDGKKANVSIGISYDVLPQILVAHKKYFEEVKKPVLVHSDIWDGNIFIKDKRISGIIDWERALWGDGLMEDRFRSHCCNNSFLNSYGIKELSKDEKIRCLWYDIYLYTTMMIEGTYRNYKTNDQYNWVKGLFDKSYNLLNSI